MTADEDEAEQVVADPGIELGTVPGHLDPDLARQLFALVLEARRAAQQVDRPVLGSGH